MEALRLRGVGGCLRPLSKPGPQSRRSWPLPCARQQQHQHAASAGEARQRIHHYHCLAPPLAQVRTRTHPVRPGRSRSHHHHHHHHHSRRPFSSACATHINVTGHRATAAEPVAAAAIGAGAGAVGASDFRTKSPTEDAQEARKKQARRPWHHEGATMAPAEKGGDQGSADIHQSSGAKGKVLTTPSRLLKLILPLAFKYRDKPLYSSEQRGQQASGNGSGDGGSYGHGQLPQAEPLALLVHPQQPLSYLERLIQAELPTIRNAKGEEKVPYVYFRAQDPEEDPLGADSAPASILTTTTSTTAAPATAGISTEDEGAKGATGATDATSTANVKSRNSDSGIDDITQTTTDRLSQRQVQQLRGGPGEGGVETYGNLGREGPGAAATATTATTAPHLRHQHHDGGTASAGGVSDEGATGAKGATGVTGAAGPRALVRWSASTEIGDFIRDAARGAEFAIEIEGWPAPMLVGVPSFGARTHYLRARLRRLGHEIAALAAVKSECDAAAFQGARRVAMGGFGLLAGWWYVVYWLTFQTNKGWDVVEPLTYLVGLSTVMCGYLWFLFHNREVSYRAALNLTVSRRQARLYAARGFDLERWQALVDEARAVRAEIRAVAQQYNVAWDERADAGADARQQRAVAVLDKVDEEQRGQGNNKETAVSGKQ